MHAASPRPDPRPRVTTPGDAERLVGEALAALEGLGPLVVAETAALGAGDLTAALALGDDKAAAARRYGLAVEAVKANAVAIARFRPPSLDTLRRHHETFAEQLDLNMAVLSTARAVSEGLLRELAADVAQARAPQGYGATGASAGGYRTPSAPLAIRRSA
jgi:hypothetical protein